MRRGCYRGVGRGGEGCCCRRRRRASAQLHRASAQATDRAWRYLVRALPAPHRASAWALARQPNEQPASARQPRRACSTQASEPTEHGSAPPERPCQHPTWRRQASPHRSSLRPASARPNERRASGRRASAHPMRMQASAQRVLPLRPASVPRQHFRRRPGRHDASVRLAGGEPREAQHSRTRSLRTRPFPAGSRVRP